MFRAQALRSTALRGIVNALLTNEAAVGVRQARQLPDGSSLIWLKVNQFTETKRRSSRQRIYREMSSIMVFHAPVPLHPESGRPVGQAALATVCS